MVSRIIILSAAVFLVAQAFSIDPFKIDKVPTMNFLLLDNFMYFFFKQYVKTKKQLKNLSQRWERFKKAYNKTYPSDSEEARRHAIWRNNTVLIM